MVGTCEECARRNIAFTAQAPVLNPLSINELCYRWSCDLCSFPESKRGYVSEQAALHCEVNCQLHVLVC